MVIDFHTHAFADKIAARAIERTEDTLMKSDYPFKEPALTDGTADDLMKKMNEWGVDKAVVLPIATKPSQQKIINDWAHDKMSERLIFFGTVHPEAEDVFDELERIKRLGLRGIKLHPDYQGFFADEERMYPIYRKCAELGLPVIFHAGYDVLSPDCVHGTPERFASVNDAVPEMTMILAHMGGNEMWDEVERLLVGRDIYFDTSFAANHISDAQAERIIKNHGADKILFASDCPWQSSKVNADFVNRLHLTDDEKKKIFYLNAEYILEIC